MQPISRVAICSCTLKSYQKRSFSSLRNDDVPLAWGDWQTDPFVIVNKPAGIQMQSEDPRFDSLEKWIIRSLQTKNKKVKNVQNVYFPHRIDRETQGLVVATLNPQVVNQMNQQVSQWTKRYRVLVRIPDFVVQRHFGLPITSPLPLMSPYLTGSLIAKNNGYLMQRGYLKSFLARAPPVLKTEEKIKEFLRVKNLTFPVATFYAKPKKPTLKVLHYALMRDQIKVRDNAIFIHRPNFSQSVPNEERFEGKYSVTDFNLLQVNWDTKLALYDANLITGRNHQLRVHFSDAGFPIVGDKIYNKTDSGSFLGLQAHLLELKHPKSGKKIQASLSIPSEFNALLNKK